MNEKLVQALDLLQKENYTCIMVKENSVYASKDNGIKPILQPLNQDENFFAEGWVADRVIGKSAAMLLVKGQVKGIYGEIMSEHALKFLNQCKIEIAYETLVPYIENREKTGMCPMETLVLDTEDTTEAFEWLNRKVKEMGEKKK